MLLACLSLVAVAFVLGVGCTFAARAIGRRLNAMDGAGVAGQVKAQVQRVPNIGGVGIFWAMVTPMIAGLVVFHTPLVNKAQELVPALRTFTPLLTEQLPTAIWFLAGMTVLHVLGLIDDRKPLGPRLKLAVMAVVAAIVINRTDSRLLTMLDDKAGGLWLSTALTIVWVIVVTNALNFLDNMDGLTAGIAAIAGGCFLAAACIHEQWFVAATLALLVGSCLGFLVFNFPMPKASIFMGDGGSLVVGYTLAMMTVRTTYIDANLAGGWYAVLMPLVVLAVPLYDFVYVVILRISQGRSPFMGDLQHLSHRLVQRGMSRRDAVLVIYGLTAITSLAGVVMGSLKPWQAAVIGGQVLLVLGVVAVYEKRAVRDVDAGDSH